ncbi:MAG: hypothetical protein HOW73_47290 [Polyangiaceae bacterium]|nr:hypothetical protein [Polyangiaceae bacterium]
MHQQPNSHKEVATHIALVDSDATTRRLLSAALWMEGCVVTAGPTIASFPQDAPDGGPWGAVVAVIRDEHRTDPNEQKALASLRHFLSGLRDVPLVVVTSFGSCEAEKIAASIRAEARCGGSLDLRAIRTAVREVVAKRPRKAQLAS